MSPPRIGSGEFAFETETYPKKDFSQVIRAERFEILGELGRGEWGTVYKVFDKKQFREWAIKKATPTETAQAQMAHRGLKLEEIAARDARGPIASRNVAPGFLYTDDDGVDFVLLDIYEKSFEEVAADKKQMREHHLRWKKEKRFTLPGQEPQEIPETLKSGFNLHEVIDYMKQLTSGLDEFYDGLRKADEYKRKRMEEIRNKEWIESGRMKFYGVGHNDSLVMSHGDLKFDNYMVTHVNYKYSALRLLIADKGTATCVSQLSGKAPRDNIGAINIRAPEQYKLDALPDQRSDMWQLGCNLYRLLTGDYPFEKEIAENPNFIAESSPETLDKIVKKKTKNIPRIFRKLNRKMLEAYSWNRLDLEELATSLDEIEKKTHTKEYISETVFRHAGKIVAGLALAGMLLYADATRQATDMKIPDRIKTPTIYVDAEKSGKPVIFLAENMEHESKLHSPYDNPGLVFHVGTGDHLTKNYYAARLFELYDYCIKNTGSLFGSKYSTDAQFNIWIANTVPDERHTPFPNSYTARVVKSIEYALAKAVPPKYKAKPLGIIESDSGHIDIEDFAVIARLGDEKLRDAKDVAGSAEYKNYIDAKYANGTYVIDRDEKVFLEEFITQIIDAGRYLRIVQE